MTELDLIPAHHALWSHRVGGDRKRLQHADTASDLPGRLIAGHSQWGCVYAFRQQ